MDRRANERDENTLTPCSQSALELETDESRPHVSLPPGESIRISTPMYLYKIRLLDIGATKIALTVTLPRVSEVSQGATRQRAGTLGKQTRQLFSACRLFSVAGKCLAFRFFLLYVSPVRLAPLISTLSALALSSLIRYPRATACKGNTTLPCPPMMSSTFSSM